LEYLLCFLFTYTPYLYLLCRGTVHKGHRVHVHVHSQVFAVEPHDGRVLVELGREANLPS